MARSQISIKLDEDLLAQVDRLAADIGVNRTALIEQAIKNDLPRQEAFHKSLENPIVRAVHEQVTKPGVLRAIAKMVDAGFTDEDIDTIVEKGPRQREAAKRRVREKRKGAE